MNPRRKQRLILVLFLVVGVSISLGLVLFALQNNINLFYSPTQIANGEVPQGGRIRAGGMVVKGSIQRDPGSLRVDFAITDYENTVKMTYSGILPDLFGEEQGVVATGRLNADGVFEAEEVLAKHDENYMPPEVADALEQTGHGAKVGDRGQRYQGGEK
ncbi:MAG: cytochrome c maturation protein CcmE [Gammaproteobacteria bacterium]|nr:MAG: cytochrome c maturation protein CcmE [Gammaproteobacteria bacterium]